MKIISPTFQVLSYSPELTKIIELGGRTCYASCDKITETSYVDIIPRWMNDKHFSVLEHGSITVKFVTDRGVTHELVRHRMASFSQESTRYCNYGKGKFGNEITVIEPYFFESNSIRYMLWKNSCEQTERDYMALLQNGASAQEARSVLPNSLKTEIIMTANPREWRHVLALRTHRDAHPQIRQICCPLLAKFRTLWPVLFDDVGDTEHECPASEVV